MIATTVGYLFELGAEAKSLLLLLKILLSVPGTGKSEKEWICESSPTLLLVTRFLLAVITSGSSTLALQRSCWRGRLL